MDVGARDGLLAPQDRGKRCAGEKSEHGSPAAVQRSRAERDVASGRQGEELDQVPGRVAAEAGVDIVDWVQLPGLSARREGVGRVASIFGQYDNNRRRGCPKCPPGENGPGGDSFIA